jgi:hypothetical protein
MMYNNKYTSNGMEWNGMECNGIMESWNHGIMESWNHGMKWNVMELDLHNLNGLDKQCQKTAL